VIKKGRQQCRPFAVFAVAPREKVIDFFAVGDNKLIYIKALAKPVARQGRKATGLIGKMTAGLQKSCFFCSPAVSAQGRKPWTDKVL
jgi:hypothetical protein